MGVPYRTNIAVESDIQHYDGITQDSTVSFELRHAFADWDKIWLNPTISPNTKLASGTFSTMKAHPCLGKGLGLAGLISLTRFLMVTNAPAFV